MSRTGTEQQLPELTEQDQPLYTPHELCTASVRYVLESVNTVQYLIRSIEEVSGKPFAADRIKCLPSVPVTFQNRRADRTTASGTLAPTQFAAGYIWGNVRPDCQKGDVVVIEDHIAALAQRGKSDKASKPAATASTPPSSTPSDGAPVLTTPYLEGQQRFVLNHVERMLRHELIHAFDDARGYIDSSNCVQQACSEIRAARLSGDCFASEEVKKGRFNLFQGGLQCVRRRAILAVDSNPVCKGFSERAVETVFKQCYSDYEPFVAPVYAMGSYGKETFANSTLKL